VISEVNPSELVKCSSENICLVIIFFSLHLTGSLGFNKDIQIPSKHNKIYYTLPLMDYMFRLLRVIIRPSSELIQNCLILSALWDPVALTIFGAIVLWVHLCYYSVYGDLCYYITM